MDRALIIAVQNACTDELRRRPWRGLENRIAGHCYVACEAIWHMLSPIERAVWKPATIRHGVSVHWFLRTSYGNICDPTSGQFVDTPKYHLGRCRGFLTKQPSKRARIVISRVARSMLCATIRASVVKLSQDI